VAALGIVAAAMSPVEDDQEGEMKWLPIETAPRPSGREPSVPILACWWEPPLRVEGEFDEPGFWRQAVVSWHAQRGQWLDGSDFPPEPTHWMPLPAPPDALIPVFADTGDDEGR
jgi:hypothetical protein